MRRAAWPPRRWRRALQVLTKKRFELTGCMCGILDGQDIKRRFPAVLDIGAGPGYIAKHLDPEITQKLTMTDSSGEHSLPTGCFLSCLAALRLRVLTLSTCFAEAMLYRDVDEELESESHPVSVDICPNTIVADLSSGCSRCREDRVRRGDFAVRRGFARRDHVMPIAALGQRPAR